jgi:2-polyprenyl-6-methoxyphenol hydroxylase-like FAD-dependent oxidoreductase
VVLPRDKLVGVLYEFIIENYRDRIDLHFNTEVLPTDWDYKDGKRALVKVCPCEELSRVNPSSVKTAFLEQPGKLSSSQSFSLLETDFLIAADGTVRTMANSIEASDARRVMKMNPLRRAPERPFRVRRYADDNQRVYKTVPMRLPSGWRWDLNYSARTAEGRVNFDALPANSNGDYCGVLLLRSGDAMATEGVDPAEFRRFLDSALPQFSSLLDDDTVASVAEKPVSYLPGFRYSGPRLHQGSCCVLVGDSAHTVKPYFGLGANSALEDVLVLSDVLDAKGTDLGDAAREYSKRRAKDAETLVRLSRELDRPGKVGFMTFIFPLILDSIFHGLAPKLFAPNIITMLQREQFTFQQVATRKRVDRIVQVTCIGAAMSCASLFVSWILSRMAVMVGSKLRAALLFALFAAAAKFTAGPLSSIASLLSKKVTNSRTFLTPLRNLAKDSRNGETFLTPVGNNDKSE